MDEFFKLLAAIDEAIYVDGDVGAAIGLSVLMPPWLGAEMRAHLDAVWEWVVSPPAMPAGWTYGVAYEERFSTAFSLLRRLKGR